jgi:hypothetical protein
MSAESINILIALSSWAIVIVTIILVTKQIRTAKKDLQIRTLMAYEEKFDSESMLKDRKKLAEQLRDNAVHKEIRENVMNFFESLGMLLKRKAIDKKMVWGTFSYYCIYWYEISKGHIKDEQALNDNDETLFADFRYLAETMYVLDEKEKAKKKNKEAKMDLRKQDIDRFRDDEISVI